MATLRDLHPVGGKHAAHRADNIDDAQEMLEQDMRRFMQDMFGGAPSLWHMGQWTGGFTPDIDVTELVNEVIVCAELPGVEPRDIHVYVSGQTLTLSGNKTPTPHEKDERYHRFERTWGRFFRTVELPVSLDAEKSGATYKKGVLTVRIPKGHANGHKTIRVR